MTCTLCDAGFPKTGPFHYPSQSKGLIPVTLCRDEKPQGEPLYAAYHGTTQIYHGWSEKEAYRALAHHVDNCAHKNDQGRVEECFCNDCIRRRFPKAVTA